MPEAPYYALKVKLNPEGRHDLRTVRALGGYQTFALACDGAVRACRASQQDDDAHQFRYLVRPRASVPSGVFARAAAGKRRWEIAKDSQAR